MPETKEGTCPWCERHNQTLYLAVGTNYSHEIMIEYICAKCMAAWKQLGEETRRGSENDRAD